MGRNYGRKLRRGGARRGASTRARSLRGFTLIEILIVIVIIAILAALLFPVFERVREGGRSMACISNMKQLGLAFQQYMNDNKRYPMAGQYQRWNGGGHWVAGQGARTDVGDAPNSGENFALANSTDGAYIDGRSAAVEKGAIFPYVRNAGVYLCPSNEYGEDKRMSYSMNCAVAGLREDRIRDASSIVVLIDEKDANDGFFWAGSVNNGVPELPGGAGDSIDIFNSIHNGNGTLLFVDGHAKSIPFETFPADYTANGVNIKRRLTGSPRFHDRGFGPNGSNVVSGATTDTCFAPVATPTPTPPPPPAA